MHPDALPLTTLLLREYGGVLAPAHLARLLGYENVNALARARATGRLPVRVFTIPGRRGWFASTIDVAQWLASTTATHAMAKAS